MRPQIPRERIVPKIRIGNGDASLFDLALIVLRVSKVVAQGS
jgi:hypothetical protein